MTLQTLTLRPGLLVSLKTSLTGNVSYQKTILESEHKTEGGAAVERWETERTVTDPVEHEAGKKARGKARSIISAICSKSAFGLLCPENKADELEKAIATARGLAGEFNTGAKFSRILVYVIAGRIAADDVEAVKAINSEICELILAMEIGIQSLDVSVIREAADDAKQLTQMLTKPNQVRLQIAIDTARKVAREIVKAGESAAIEIDNAAIRKLREVRSAFLDVDEASETVTPAEPELDFNPELDDRENVSARRYLG